MKRTWANFFAIPPMALFLVPVSGETSPAHAQYGAIIANSIRNCAPGAGPVVLLTIRGIKSSTGKIRLQSYHARKEDWREKDRWINRIEMPGHKGNITLCLPLPKAGAYAVTVRHDANDNNETGLNADGGALSNNPPINPFNLGRPGIEKTRFMIGRKVKSMSIAMLYFG